MLDFSILIFFKCEMIDNNLYFNNRNSRELV